MVMRLEVILGDLEMKTEPIKRVGRVERNMTTTDHVIGEVLAWTGEAIGELEILRSGDVIIGQAASEVRAWRGRVIGELAVFQTGDAIIMKTTPGTKRGIGMAQGKRMTTGTQDRDQASCQRERRAMRTLENPKEMMTITTKDQMDIAGPGNM
jgi:hypothetical protein